MKLSVVVYALVVCLAFAGRVCAQTYTPGELAATRVVADAQARADALRRRIDAPTATPVPTELPTEIPTATAATSTPLPPMPSVVTVIVIQQVQPTTAPTAISQTAAPIPTQRDNSISARLERSIPFAVFIVLVLVLGRFGMIYAQRRGL